MTTQQQACKEAIERLIDKVESLEIIVEKLIGFLYLELGERAAAELLRDIRLIRQQEDSQ